MVLDQRWKNPQGSTPQQLYLWAQDLIRTLRGSGAEPFADQLDDAFMAQLDATFGTTRGSIIYRNATEWVALTPGTAGHRLQTNGAGADPTWAALPVVTWVDVANGATTSGTTETFTDLGSYRDISFFLERVSSSSTTSFQMEVSADNGSTWATVLQGMSGGALANIIPISGAIADGSNYSCSGTIYGWGTTVGRKRVSITNGQATLDLPTAIVSTSQFNAIRFSTSAGNFDNGNIFITGIQN